jgi:DNA-binding IclR family transcriptional regulator
MAYLTLERNDLHQLATPFLRYLSEQYKENIHLAVLDDTDVVFVNIIESPQRIKLAAALGQRLPAFATASGKAILAFMPDDTVRRILKRGMPQYTQYTPLSPEALFEDLRHVREQGYALSEQEYEEEINAVAAPIYNVEGQPIASVAIAGPSYRLTRERMIDIGPHVHATARDITQEMKMAAISQVNTTVATSIAAKINKHY